MTAMTQLDATLGVVPLFSPSSGGEFQYSLSILDSLVRLDIEPRGIVFARATDRAHLGSVETQAFRVAPLEPDPISRLADRGKNILRELPFASMLQELRKRLRRLGHDGAGQAAAPAEGRSYSRYFREAGAELLLFTVPTTLCIGSELPFLMPIHDFQHRLQRHFPEVSADGEFERREFIFGAAARSARAILVDSETGKEDALACYGELGLTPDRVEVLPFLPPDYLQRQVSPDERKAVRQRYGLPQRYLFYPAQFWPHKNHKRLVEAVARLAPRHGDLQLVLAGTAAGRLRESTQRDALEVAARQGIESRIHLLGYVPNADMAPLYAEAEALVFPTFFGPTNIPILEAWAHGCPVVTSAIRGIREQVGEAALLADPNNAESIADSVERVWTDAALRSRLARLGTERLGQYGHRAFDARLASILRRAASR